jgi:hypothetical protein
MNEASARTADMSAISGVFSGKADVWRTGKNGVLERT